MQAPSLSSHLNGFGETQASWLMQDGIPTWYHGSISRESAESLLQEKPLGCFLVRMSQSHVGYTLSYRSKDCCRHFIIELLPDGCLAISGENGVHATLMELVSFYQKNAIQPFEELLTQPCVRVNENDVKYDNLSLYSNVAVGGKTSPVDGSSAHMPKPCLSPPITVSLRPMPLPWKKMTVKPKADTPDTSSQPFDQSPATSHAQKSGKALLNNAPQKIWKNLKNLPQTGKKITEQIKSHLPDMTLSFPLASVAAERHKEGQAREVPSPVRDESVAQEEESHPEREAQNSPINIYVDPFEQTSYPKHTSHSKIQHLDLSLRKLVRTSTIPISTSEKPILPGPGRATISEGTTSQDCPRTVSDKLCFLPEEYRPPPPFAPGY
ncbi:hematopoietic SH2 domain-containing protein [Gracilinanus agilis]|uniref:hematopoietic SH2 domain-containing protein n=1 Tax=Gracilinanus agilis TaxID=191870 RepID=UPI001CFC65F7|nr:hematopoietic SH2 domain-containing protein [Gracilinanus agilis]